MTTIPSTRVASRPRAGMTPKLAAWRSLDLTSLTTHVGFITALCLQRFGVPFGSNTLSISLPILMLLAVWLLLQRRVYAPAYAALFFGLFVAWALLATAAAMAAPDNRVGFSITSLLELLCLYAPLVLRPRQQHVSQKVQRIFLFYVRLCAVLGIMQFALQFAHLRLFSVSERLPGLWHWTLERDFAVISPVSYGSSILRSNGFFLLEPSIFSQLLALGILVDVFVIGQKRYLPLYALAYLTTFSGTGMLSLALTLGLIGLTSTRTASRVLLLALVGVVAAGLMALVAPGLFHIFSGRATELQSTQTSAYARYIAPLAELKAFAGEMRLFLGYGPGATARSAVYTAGSGSAALQLTIDYGLVGMVLFFCFLAAALWRRGAAALSLMLLIDFQFGGGFLLIPPFVMIMGVLGVWGGGAPTTGVQPQRRSSLGLSVGRYAGAHREPVFASERPGSAPTAGRFSTAGS